MRTRVVAAAAAAACIAITTAACATASGSREARIPGERQDCQNAAARVSSASATPDDFKTLGWCDETGPSVLAGVWRALPSDTARLRMFLGASANVRDGRIYAAAHTVASDSSRRSRERAAALLTLVAQVDSAATVTIVPASRTEGWRAQLARETHPSQIAGMTPLPADARKRVNALVQSLAAKVPTGAAGLRDPLGVAVQAARLDLQRVR